MKRTTMITLLGAVLLLGAPWAQRAQARGHVAAKPIYGGTVSIRDIFGSNCLNPLDPQNVGPAVGPTVDPLIAVDDRGRYRSDLALSWKVSKGGRWITLTLRRGVKFSNGHTFNASVLKTELDYFLKQSSYLAPLQRAQVLGPYALRLVYGAPFRPALDSLTAFDAVDTRAELAMGDRACSDPIGTGAFKVSSIGPGFNTITLVRNPYHTWGSPYLSNQGKAYLSAMTIKTVVDDTQAASEVLAGDLDISRVAPAQLPRLQGQPGIVLHKFPEPGELYMGFNHSHAPFNNPAVRRAIAEAIDRKGLVKVAYGGLGSVQASIVPQVDRYSDAAAGKSIPAYNPDDAARILKANHVTGPYTLETYTIPVFAATAQFIQAELENVGVKINLAVKSPGDAQADMGHGQMDLFVDIIFGDDLYSTFHSSQTPASGAHNWTFLHDATLDRLIVQARDTVSPKAARPILNRLQVYMNAKAIAVPLFSRRLVAATRTRVHGYHYIPGSNTLMWPAFEDLYVK